MVSLTFQRPALPLKCAFGSKQKVGLEELSVLFHLKVECLVSSHTSHSHNLHGAPNSFHWHLLQLLNVTSRLPVGNPFSSTGIGPQQTVQTGKFPSASKSLQCAGGISGIFVSESLHPCKGRISASNKMYLFILRCVQVPCRVLGVGKNTSKIPGCFLCRAWRIAFSRVGCGPL